MEWFLSVLVLIPPLYVSTEDGGEAFFGAGLSISALEKLAPCKAIED